jgi:hypothetical protein
MVALDKPGKLFFICSSLAFQGDIFDHVWVQDDGACGAGNFSYGAAQRL